MSGHRLRRWPDIDPASEHHPVKAIYPAIYGIYRSMTWDYLITGHCLNTAQKQTLNKTKKHSVQFPLLAKHLIYFKLFKLYFLIVF